MYLLFVSLLSEKKFNCYLNCCWGESFSTFEPMSDLPLELSLLHVECQKIPVGNENSTNKSRDPLSSDMNEIEG